MTTTHAVALAATVPDEAPPGVFICIAVVLALMLILGACAYYFVTHPHGTEGYKRGPDGRGWVPTRRTANEIARGREKIDREIERARHNPVVFHPGLKSQAERERATDTDGDDDDERRPNGRGPRGIYPA